MHFFTSRRQARCRHHLDASQDFTLIDALVQNIGSLIFALSADVQQAALISAVALDLIDPRFTDRIPEIVKQLQALRVTDMLNQPYLVGSATLSQILGAAAVPAAQQQAFSQALGRIPSRCAISGALWEMVSTASRRQKHRRLNAHCLSARS